MIRYLENHSLRNNNTFGIDAAAKYFFEFTELEDFLAFLSTHETLFRQKLLILGGGSNLLFLNDFDGLVVYPNLPGITKINESRNHVWLEVGAGVEWDELVDYTVFNQWGGLENLSLIPGRVGAAPVQNIGAYGIEVKDCIEEVKGIDLETFRLRILNHEQCGFGYRDSIFKTELKDRFLITSVTFRLEKFPEFHIDYGDLMAEVEACGGVSLANIRRAVIQIRESKLPDPLIMGNAGSFFKNPVVEMSKGKQLMADYPSIPLYYSSEQKTKVAAGWLIDQCGWKGYREGDAGVHARQALVLVNYGQATGKEIFSLSEKIRISVMEKFGIELEREVNMVE